MLNFNLSLCEFTFNGSNQVIANIPTNHDYLLQPGSAKIQFFGPQLYEAKIIEITPFEQNSAVVAVTFAFTLPIVF